MARGPYIDVDFADDELITDVIARLDEIPDDGPPSSGEVRDWIRMLSRA